MMSHRRWRRASRLQQELSLHGAAGEEGVCLGGLAQREPAGDPGVELARSHLVEHGGEGSGPLLRAAEVVAGRDPAQGKGTRGTAVAGDALQPAGVERADRAA